MEIQRKIVVIRTDDRLDAHPEAAVLASEAESPLGPRIHLANVCKVLVTFSILCYS